MIVPRVAPRLEQFIRASRLRELGVLDLLHPGDLSPTALTSWLLGDVRFASARSLLNLDGLERVPELLDELLQARLGVLEAVAMDA